MTVDPEALRLEERMIHRFPRFTQKVATDETQPGTDARQYGDYEGLAVANGVAHPIWTDSREAAMTESGDVIAANARLVGEIGAVANGALGGRRAPGEVTVFKSLGVAVEDVASAELVWRRLAEPGGKAG